MNRPEVVPAGFEAELARQLVGNVAVMGIGNTMRCDDGFGVLLTKSLQRAGLPGALRLFVCEMTPENFVGPVSRSEPDTILMIDTAEIGEPPGSVRLLNAQDIAESGMTTHNLSLSLLATMLESATNASVLLLAVQPKTVGFGEEISPEVSQTLDYLTELFERVSVRES
jgi:hydrogenase 3 maturation protease